MSDWTEPVSEVSQSTDASGPRESEREPPEIGKLLQDMVEDAVTVFGSCRA